MLVFQQTITEELEEDSLPSSSILQPLHEPNTVETDSTSTTESKKISTALQGTPPRLPSPKLDSSLPRRSSRVLYESESPISTGGKSTPKDHPVATPTNSSLKSASEFHSRIVEAFIVEDKNATGKSIFLTNK